MSRLTLFVALSILINVGSVVAYLRNQSEALPPAVTAPSPATVESTTPLPSDQPIWNTLQPEPSTKALPSASFVARLRAAGFPTDIIRVIVRQQIEDYYAPREAAIAAAHDTINYWETKYGTNASYRESGPERIAVRLEKNALMRQLLGDDAETPRERARRARDYGNIPIETVDRLTTLRTEFDHLEIELRERAQGTMLPSDRAEAERLRTERQNAITALFTPDELATYELHAGDSSNNLRDKLRWIKPSESEFLNLYVSQLEFDQQFSRAPDATATPEERQAWNTARLAAQTQLEADFASALSPERYADYQITTSPFYRTMRGITDQFELPGELAATMTRSHLTVIASAESVLADSSLSASDRAAKIETLVAQSTAAFADQLSPTALAAYARDLKRRLQMFQSQLRRAASAPGN